MERSKATAQAIHMSIIAIALVLVAVLIARGSEGADISVPDDYPTVQQAVDNASAGDRILVGGGTFNESIDVDKQLDIVGDGPDRTVLRFEDSHVLHVTASDCYVASLCIEGANEGNGLTLEDAHGCGFEDVLFLDNVRGVGLENADGNSFTNCIFRDNGDGVMFGSDSDGNVFTDCTFLDNEVGIDINWASPDQAIENNTFTRCDVRGSRLGIYIEESGVNNKFRGCTVTNNSVGVKFRGGASDSFYDCTVDGNAGDGFLIHKSVDILLRDCHVGANGGVGINLSEAGECTVTGGEVVGNDVGVQVDQGSVNNSFLFVTVRLNRLGLVLGSVPGSTFPNSTRNSFNTCNFDDNHEGASVMEAAPLNFFTSCTFSRNEGSGMSLRASRTWLLACTFSANGGYGAVVRTPTNRTVIVECGFHDNGLNGLDVYDGSGYLIQEVHASGNIEGIRLEDCQSNSITDCLVEGNTHGLVLDSQSWYNVIRNVTSRDNNESGIMLDTMAGHNLVEGCLITRNKPGINFRYINEGNVIANCTIDDNAECGISMPYGRETVIINCSLTNTRWTWTQGYGVWCDVYGSNVSIIGCNVSGNEKGGISFGSTHSMYTRGGYVIRDCVVADNDYTGIGVGVGDVLVEGNTVTGNTHMGIGLGDCPGTRVMRNTVTRNNIGIRLFFSPRTEIGWNTVVDNAQDGIAVNWSGVDGGHWIHNNTVRGNGLRPSYRGGITFYPHESVNCLVENNLIDGNRVGLYIVAGNTRTEGSNVFRFNVISNSTVAAIYCLRSLPNEFYLNVFFDNAAQVIGANESDVYDNGTLGNYWDDYEDRYPDARRVGAVWDTPYVVNATLGIVDRYPLAFVYETNPPVARGGPDIHVSFGDTAHLNASDSSDDSAIAAYVWTVTTPSGDVRVHDQAWPGLDLVAEELGNYTVVLSVVDVWGRSSTDDVLVVSVVDDVAPTAAAGEDAVVDVAQPVVLDASASTDNLGILSYRWTLLVDDVPVDYAGEQVTVTFDRVGVFTVTLRVTDLVGNEGTDTVVVTVRDLTPPVADAGTDVTVDQDGAVELDASGSTDVAGILHWNWSYDDGGRTVTLSGERVSHTFPGPGVYHVTLEVSDVGGNTGGDEVTVTVLDTEPPAAVAWAEGVVLDQGDLLRLDALGSTDNVGVERYSWSLFHQGEEREFPGHLLELEMRDLGDFEVVLTVWDAAGNSGQASLTVHVLDAVPPVAVASFNGTAIEGAEVVLDANGSHDDNGIVDYWWTFMYRGQEVNLSGNRVVFRFEEPGEYVLTLTVMDVGGNQGTATTTITVHPQPAEERGWGLVIVLAVVAVVVVCVAIGGVALKQRR